MLYRARKPSVTYPRWKRVSADATLLRGRHPVVNDPAYKALSSRTQPPNGAPAPSGFLGRTGRGQGPRTTQGRTTTQGRRARRRGTGPDYTTGSQGATARDGASGETAIRRQENLLVRRRIGNIAHAAREEDVGAGDGAGDAGAAWRTQGGGRPGGRVRGRRATRRAAQRTQEPQRRTRHSFQVGEARGLRVHGGAGPPWGREAATGGPGEGYDGPPPRPRPRA